MPAWEAWGGPSRRSRRAGHPLPLGQEPQIPAPLALGSAFRCQGRGDVAASLGRGPLQVCRPPRVYWESGHPVPLSGGCFSLQPFSTLWEQPARTSSVGEMPWNLRQNCLASDPRRILRNKYLPDSCLLVRAALVSSPESGP